MNGMTAGSREDFSPHRARSGTAEGGTAPPWVPRDSKRDSFLSCLEGNRSDRGPAAATRAVITFWGIKAEPHSLLFSIEAQEQGTAHMGPWGGDRSVPCSD